MAWYTATHTCGHTEDINLIGPGDSRKQALALMERQACLPCFQAEQRRQATADAEQRGLPALTGTEKQIGWALTLRRQALASVVEFGEQSASRIKSEQRGQLDELVAATLARLSAETRPAWFLDRRGLDGQGHCRQTAQAATAAK